MAKSISAQLARMARPKYRNYKAKEKVDDNKYTQMVEWYPTKKKALRYAKDFEKLGLGINPIVTSAKNTPRSDRRSGYWIRITAQDQRNMSNKGLFADGKFG